MARELIQIEKVSKIYHGSKTPAVNNLTLKIKKGEVYGFLGSNGAGKSTTIRMMMDFIRPTAGEIKIFGLDSKHDSVNIKKRVGYLSGDVVLPKRTTGRKVIEYLANLNGNVDESYLRMLVDRFEAEVDKKTETLSKGNRQKIGLILAFMSQPDLIILDEPTSGLDPVMQDRFYQTVNEVRARGGTIFLSSHIFSEVEKICDNVGIIKAGKLVYDGKITGLAGKVLPTIQVGLKRKSDLIELKKMKHVKIVSLQSNLVTLKIVGGISEALSELSKIYISSINVLHDDLESEFMNYYDKGEDNV